MTRTRRSALIAAAVAAAALGGAVAAAPAAAEDPPGGIAPGTAFAAFEAQVLTRPQAVLAADGRRHIAYELVLTGTTSATIRSPRSPCGTPAASACS